MNYGVKTHRNPFLRFLIVGLIALALPQIVAAQGVDGLSTATLTRSSKNKDTFTTNFTVNNPSAPYTMEIYSGLSDGSQRPKKGWVTLNGQTLVVPPVFTKSRYALIIAIHPQQSNQLEIKLKGGNPGSFITVAVHPTENTTLNPPGSAGFDAGEAGLGVPFGVAVNSSNHQAFVSDRYYGTVVQFDIQSSAITQRFNAADSSTPLGGAATTGLRLNSAMNQLVAMNEGVNADDVASIAVINLNNESVKILPLMYSGETVHSTFVATDSTNSIAACAGLYDGGHFLYFMDLSSGSVTRVQSSFSLTAPVYYSAANQFIFSAQGSGSPSLAAFSAQSPYGQATVIKSTAPAGTYFEKVAVNSAAKIAVAVDQQDSAAYVFDLAAGSQIARIPIITGGSGYSSADVAINPVTNQALITSNFSDRLTVIDLGSMLVMAEIPLPTGAMPLGVDVDTSLNRAIVSEDGLSSNTRNGSIFVVQLPDAVK